MRRVNDSQVIIRRTIQQNIGIIQLPDEYMMGKNSSSSEYRFAEVVDGASPLAPGMKVIVHEMGSQSLELIGDKIHRAPIDFILAYINDTGAIQCLRNLVLVKPDPKEETVSGSFILAPESSRLPQTTGVVVNIGPDCKYVEVGQKALYALFSGVEVELGGQEYILLREEPPKGWTDEIVGILTNE